MKATEILMSEHRVIERVIVSLEVQTERLAAQEAVRPGFFLEAADFIKGFADGCHHRKEEGVLFEAMVGAGLPRQAGPIAVMLTEHEQGRAFTRGMCRGGRAPGGRRWSRPRVRWLPVRAATRGCCASTSKRRMASSSRWSIK